MHPKPGAFRQVYAMNRKTFLPPTYFNSAIMTIILLKIFLPGVKIIAFPWNLTGIIPLAAGIFLNLSADRAFKQRRTTVKPFEESSALIRNGVFRFSRNPMYLGMAGILLGLAILLQSVFPFVVVPVFMITVDIVFIRDEEMMLEAKFGEEWRRFRHSTRKWL